MPLPPATYVPTFEDFDETMGKYDERLICPPPILKQEQTFGLYLKTKDPEHHDLNMSILIRLAQCLTQDCKIHHKKGTGSLSIPSFTEKEADGIFDYITARQFHGSGNKALREEESGVRFPIKALEVVQDDYSRMMRDTALAMMQHWQLYNFPLYHEEKTCDLAGWAIDRLPHEVRQAIAAQTMLDNDC